MERVRVPKGVLIACGVAPLLVISTATISPVAAGSQGTSAVAGREVP